jgi:hypothetical protein
MVITTSAKEALVKTFQKIHLKAVIAVKIAILDFSSLARTKQLF